jgi:hypothetical protein
MGQRGPTGRRSRFRRGGSSVRNRRFAGISARSSVDRALASGARGRPFESARARWVFCGRIGWRGARWANRWPKPLFLRPIESATRLREKCAERNAVVALAAVEQLRVDVKRHLAFSVPDVEGRARCAVPGSHLSMLRARHAARDAATAARQRGPCPRRPCSRARDQWCPRREPHRPLRACGFRRLR